MQKYSAGFGEIIQDLRAIVDALGWLRGRNPQEKSKVVEGSLLALLMHHFSGKRGEERSLIEIMNEVLVLPPFVDISEQDVILTILLFQYDKELLIRSKDLISNTWNDIDVDELYQRLPRRPSARTDVHGLSLVLYFDYPKGFLSSLTRYLAPLNNIIWPTKRPHFTVFNIGTEILVQQVERTRSLVTSQWDREIRKDFHLNSLVKSAEKATIRADELRIMRDGSLVLFGSGEFLESLHELRLKLRESVLPLDLESVLKRDAQPVWTHTVFARLVKSELDRETLSDGVRKMQQQHFPGANQRVELLDTRLGLMTFTDAKAILSPEETELTRSL